jgi:uncharacterized protein
MDDRDPGLPIKLGPCSNGEYTPPPTSEMVREAVRRARAMCDDNARRVGMDRRRFLLSSMGAATTLAALGACAFESSGGRSGGTYDVDEEAMVDADAARETLGGGQPVIDMQTHFLEYPPDYDGFHLGQLWEAFRDCGDETLDECFNTARWIEELFARSDTTLAVLSALPVTGEVDPLSAEIMDEARRQVVELCGDGRVLVQGHAWPNVGEPQAALDAMRAESERFDISAWKTYTHVGEPFSLDDHTGVPVGESFLQTVEELGPPIVCVHKGFGSVGNPPYADPVDVGPAATAHPDLSFCIYHSAYEDGVQEGPYDPAAPNGGVDRLIKTLEDHQIGPGGNVYAELGSTWRLLMADPNQAAHVLGKLLVALGPKRILWGTDSLWYGTPQDQIQAFRAFQISEEFQETYGYPALTDQVKQRILWRNAARLHRIDVARLPCRPDPAETEEARMSTRLANRTYGPRTRTLAATRRFFHAEHPWIA